MSAQAIENLAEIYNAHRRAAKSADEHDDTRWAVVGHKAEMANLRRIKRKLEAEA